MRHLLLALLIALLPLRGWVGDAMALTMVGTTAAAPVAAGGHDLPACMEHSAAVHAALHAPPPEASHAPLPAIATGDTNAHHGTPHHAAGANELSHEHNACEVCNGPAMALGWSAPPAPTQPQALDSALAVRFASSVLPQGVKPPIS